MAIPNSDLDDLLETAQRHLDRGEWRAAVALLEAVLDADPDNARARHDLARGLVGLGQDEAALDHMRAAQVLAPRSVELLNNLGALEANCGSVAAAIACYRRAAALAPANPVPLVNLAEVLVESGDIGEAVICLRTAATLDPDMAAPWSGLGSALLSQGLADQAVGPLRRAASLTPDDARTRLLLGDALQASGRLEDAADQYRRGLERDAESVAGWYGLAHAELALENWAAASLSFECYLRLDPTDGAARYGLGKALLELGETGPAMAQLRLAAASASEEAATLARQTMAIIVPGDPDSDNARILDVRRDWARPRTAAGRRRTLAVPEPPEDARLRIGYVSSFFDRPNWMKPVWALVNHHDRDRFDVHLFSDTPERGIQSGYRRHPADRVHFFGGLSNEEAARSIADCGIDILVDLNGYSRADRLGVLEARPAPVIVGWFNMYATSGSESFDYLIGDATAVPEDEERYYSEKILRVPGSYLTFEVLYPVPDVAPPPCTREGVFTFGSLASQYKLNARVVDGWAEILRRCPNTRLFLKNAALDIGDNRDHLLQRFRFLGISADRLDLAGGDDHFHFLTAYDRIDVALDTFPYNGGTTTTEALWQGVPVVAFDGDRWASRTSASILRAAGLSRFVADNVEGYIDLCTALATDRARQAELTPLRATMRDRLRAAPVCDAATFARNMESLFLEIAPARGA